MVIISVVERLWVEIANSIGYESEVGATLSKSSSVSVSLTEKLKDCG